MDPIRTKVIGAVDDVIMSLLHQFDELECTATTVPDGPDPKALPHVVILVMNDELRKVDLNELLESLGRPLLVVVSGSAADGVLAFDHDAIDLLVGPITFERLKQCVAKIRHSLLIDGNENGTMGRGGTVNNDAKELTLKSGREIIKVDPSKIQLVQGMGNYTKLHMDGTHVLVSSTMNHLAGSLPPAKFLRIHRSFIINVDHIRSVGGNRLEWTGGEITIGAIYKKEALLKLSGRISKGTELK